MLLLLFLSLHLTASFLEILSSPHRPIQRNLVILIKTLFKVRISLLLLISLMADLHRIPHQAVNHLWMMTRSTLQLNKPTMTLSLPLLRIFRNQQSQSTVRYDNFETNLFQKLLWSRVQEYVRVPWRYYVVELFGTFFGFWSFIFGFINWFSLV